MLSKIIAILSWPIPVLLIGLMLWWEPTRFIAAALVAMVVISGLFTEVSRALEKRKPGSAQIVRDYFVAGIIVFVFAASAITLVVQVLRYTVGGVQPRAERYDGESERTCDDPVRSRC